jgi:predicted nuclease of predicted toxin-antitoxin system
MKRLALDENVPRASVRLLLAQGIDILDIHSSHRGLPDEAIVTICNKEQRILATFDRDFYLRLNHFTPTRPAKILLEPLQAGPPNLKIDRSGR